MLFGVQRWCFSSIPRVDSPKNLIWCHVHGCHFQKRPNFKVEDPPVVMVPGYRSKHVKTRPFQDTAVTWFQGIPTGRRVEPCWNCSSENEAQFSQSHCILRLGVEDDITICPTHLSHPCPIISPWVSSHVSGANGKSIVARAPRPAVGWKRRGRRTCPEKGWPGAFGRRARTAAGLIDFDKHVEIWIYGHLKSEKPWFEWLSNTRI